MLSSEWYWKVWYFTWTGAKEEFNTGNRFNPSALGNRGNTNADKSLLINDFVSWVLLVITLCLPAFYFSSSWHHFLCLYCILHLSSSFPGWYTSVNLVLFTVIWIDVRFCVLCISCVFVPRSFFNFCRFSTLFVFECSFLFSFCFFGGFVAVLICSFCW